MTPIDDTVAAARDETVVAADDTKAGDTSAGTGVVMILTPIAEIAAAPVCAGTPEVGDTFPPGSANANPLPASETNPAAISVAIAVDRCFVIHFISSAPCMVLLLVGTDVFVVVVTGSVLRLWLVVRKLTSFG